MNYWLKQGTRLFSGVVFFTILAILLLENLPVDMNSLLKAAMYASAGSILFWFAGMVIVDIIIKGLVTHIDDDRITTLIDGGMLQRIGEMQRKMVPGGEEMPFTGEVSSSLHVKKQADR